VQNVARHAFQGFGLVIPARLQARFIAAVAAAGWIGCPSFRNTSPDLLLYDTKEKDLARDLATEVGPFEFIWNRQASSSDDGLDA
jgi:hypothetical protein